MKLSDFDYVLPKELIAQFPCEKRENSRMMCLDGVSQEIVYKNFFDIVDVLDENDVLVLNDTKVIPARLLGVRKPCVKGERMALPAESPKPFDGDVRVCVSQTPQEQKKQNTDAKIEVFLLKNVADCALTPSATKNKNLWECLIKPSKKVDKGTIVEISPDLSAEVIEKIDNGKWLVALDFKGNLYDILDEVGHIPLPPYIARNMKDNDLKNLDFNRYQTVFADKKGSVAAPTAGLHFSEDILEKLKKKGVEICYVTLNVGLGTFRPVKCENIFEHRMDSESFEISKNTCDIINNAQKNGKNIVAVGTTTVRVLETVMQKYGCIKPVKDTSELFIYPGFEFKVVDKLITNFHLPKSTLLMLVSAFAGKDFVFKAYSEAIEQKYRFYSYGDCMFLSCP